jgi:cell cycle checkpoint protein
LKDFEGEGLMQKFHAFLRRASACNNIVSVATRAAPSPSSSQQTTADRAHLRSHIILLEDLPNILHLPTQLSFQYALQSLAESTVPVVVIVSDAGLRGEDLEGGSAGWKGKQAVDVRMALGPLLKSPYVTQIT